MKYFFLSDSWTTGRVWEFGGLWNEVARRRKPYLQKRSLCIHENGEVLWLFQAEDSILMVEARPKAPACTHNSIGQVVLKRLLSAEQVIERLCEENVFQPHWHQDEANRDENYDLKPGDVAESEEVRREEAANREPAIANGTKPSALNAHQSGASSAELPASASASTPVSTPASTLASL